MGLRMKQYFIGVDLGGTRIKIGLVSGGKILSRSMVPAIATAGLESSLPLLKTEINQLLTLNQVDPGSFGGIALGFPGLVDPKKNKILSTNKKYDDARRIQLDQWVRGEWNVPFFMDNDARLAAVGEWKYGAGQDTDDLVVMTIGTGIGTSAIVEGNLLRGKHFQAGCLGGHISVDYQGRPCSCGNIGCMESHASTWSIRERILSSPAYEHSSLSASNAPIDFEKLFHAADRGDQLALEIKQDCLDVWSAGIVNLIHAYDPEVVVIGGGAMHRAADIIPYLTEKVQQHAWCPWGKVSIRRSELMGDAAILGAVHLLKCSFDSL